MFESKTRLEQILIKKQVLNGKKVWSFYNTENILISKAVFNVSKTAENVSLEVKKKRRNIRNCNYFILLELY